MAENMQVVMFDFKTWCGMPSIMGVINGTHIFVSKHLVHTWRTTSITTWDLYHHLGDGWQHKNHFKIEYVGFTSSVSDLHVLKKFDLYSCALYGGLWFDYKIARMYHLTCSKTKVTFYFHGSWLHTKKK